MKTPCNFVREYVFAKENETFSGFCQTAARRTLFVLPIAVTFSSSASIALTYMMVVLWLLGGHWKERYTIVRSSGILLASIPLILWTGVGILRYETSFWDSLRYWFGHYPYIYILIMATLLTKKEHRCMILSCMNLAIVLCCLWAIGFTWYYSNCPAVEFRQFRIHSIYLYRNTICFGMALTFWAGLWVCLPYSSRHIAWVRRLFPRILLEAVDAAATLSPLALWQDTLRRRVVVLAGLLMFLRWGIVFSVLFYLFMNNASRTAQLAILAAYSFTLLLWNWKKGLVAILVFLLPVAALAGSLSDRTQKKSMKTISDIKQAFGAIFDKDDYNSFIRINRDRLGIQLTLFPYILEKPLIGLGMEKARITTKEITGYVDPHSEFFYMTLQHGLVGLGCFLFWIMAPFVRFRHLRVPWNRFGLFLAVIVTIDCLFNNAMSYHRETLLLCIGFALLASTESFCAHNGTRFTNRVVG